ncbi:MAG TPA: hypothetical protein EYQ51_06030 [Alphaproteobacteria bacterium]|nr:hypothetical protein [Alphaproteobacteria bacterium]
MLTTRKEKIERKFTRFNELLHSILKGASAGQKKYANTLLNDIVSEYNSIDYQLRKAEAEKMSMTKVNFDSTFDMFLNIIQSLGFTEVEINQFKLNSLNFIFNHQSELKRRLNADELYKIHKMYQMFILFEDRDPVSLKELKDVITEHAS